MRLLLTLTVAQMKHHRTRMIFSWLAIASATCLVVWMVAGYHTIIAGFHDDAEDYMGRYDLVIV
ncbi:MAG: hypothetical protein Q4C47_06810, partial [Planctomycetia bacterium]|nr:hypothetical protein [Planctomycetia bacterium]